MATRRLQTARMVDLSVILSTIRGEPFVEEVRYVVSRIQVFGHDLRDRRRVCSGVVHGQAPALETTRGHQTNPLFHTVPG